MAEADDSNGYEQIAEQFLSVRNPTIGTTVIRKWSDLLPCGASVLDIGCGSGMPVSQTLSDAGLAVYGIDASAKMINAFRKHLPSAYAQCAAAENSDFFGMTFDGIVAWGLLFLLGKESQKLIIGKATAALRSGGHFLFSAPRDPIRWRDSLTGRESVSLGAARYRALLGENNFVLLNEGADDETTTTTLLANVENRKHISSAGFPTCYDEDSRSVPRWPFVPYPAYWPKLLKRRGRKSPTFKHARP